MPYDKCRNVSKLFINIWSSSPPEIKKRIPTIKQLFGQGALIPLIPASFTNSDNQFPPDNAIPSQWLRVAPVLRIEGPRHSCNGDATSICCCDGWYKWRKGWAESRVANRALEAFLENDEDYMHIDKKVQVKSSNCEDERRFSPQLSFLFLLVEGMQIRRKIPGIELLDVNGSIIPQPAVNIKQTFDLMHEMFDHGEKHHFRDKFGAIHVNFNEEKGVYAVLKPGENRKIISDSRVAGEKRTNAVEGTNTNGDASEERANVEGPSSMAKGNESNVNREANSDENMNQGDGEGDAGNDGSEDVLYEICHVPEFSKPDEQHFIMYEVHTNTLEEPAIARIHTTLRTVSCEDCPCCQGKAKKGKM